MDTWTVTLHARPGVLEDARVRESVVAAAEGLAERIGVRVSIGVEGDAVVAVVEGEEIVAVGFAAELRRATMRWAAVRGMGEIWEGEGEGPESWGGQ